MRTEIKVIYEQQDFEDIKEKMRHNAPKTPCDLCLYNPPSSGDGKPCTMCPASAMPKPTKEGNL